MHLFSHTKGKRHQQAVRESSSIQGRELSDEEVVSRHRNGFHIRPVVQKHTRKLGTSNTITKCDTSRSIITQNSTASNAKLKSKLTYCLLSLWGNKWPLSDTGEGEISPCPCTSLLTKCLSCGCFSLNTYPLTAI